MPIYEYVCDACGSGEETLQKVDDPPPTCAKDDCQDRGKPMTRKVSRTTFELKGTGWAKDGYGS